MIEPREAFKKNELSKRWLDFADGAMFQEAAKAAMLEMVLKQSSNMDGSNAVACHFKIEGAKTFLRILTGLTLADMKQPVRPTGNLDHSTLK